MPEPVTPLGGARADGYAPVREIGPLGAIALRADPAAEGLEAVVTALVGAPMPARTGIAASGGRACAWMGPDEWLILLPRAEVGAALARLAAALEGRHHLALDVSDARAAFRVEGPRALDVIRKLAPVDVDRLGEGTLRRTRLGQVAAALWRDEDGVTVLCARSVARYAFDLMANAARPGSEP